MSHLCRRPPEPAPPVDALVRLVGGGRGRGCQRGGGGDGGDGSHAADRVHLQQGVGAAATAGAPAGAAAGAAGVMRGLSGTGHAGDVERGEALLRI